MNKNNKYKIKYRFNNSNERWGIAIKKLNITLFYHRDDRKHFITKFLDRTFWDVLNNFIIEPDLIHMLKSKDDLSYQTAFEILNTRLLEKLNKNESI